MIRRMSIAGGLAVLLGMLAALLLFFIWWAPGDEWGMILAVAITLGGLVFCLSYAAMLTALSLHFVAAPDPRARPRSRRAMQVAGAWVIGIGCVWAGIAGLYSLVADVDQCMDLGGWWDRDQNICRTDYPKPPGK